MNSQKDFTVAIVGGGLVGLVCAIGLGKAGVQVDVFEAATKYGEIGAGIGIGHNALHVFELMGILKEVSENQGRMPFFSFVRSEEPHTEVYKYDDDVHEDQGLAVHRAAFLKGLERLLPSSVRSHFKKRCVSVVSTSDGRAKVRFADGSEHVADVVIGADGIKSSVRETLGERGDHLVDTGDRCYRTLLPFQRLLDAGINKEALTPRNWMGQNKQLITYSIGDGTMYNFAAFSKDPNCLMVPAGPQSSWDAWVEPVTGAQLRSQFEDFGPDARSILECVETANRWKIHGLYPPLESYVAAAPTGEQGEQAPEKDRLNVVLIGDAAHAMVPYLASGASAGIEDAHILASLLAHPQTRRANLAAVLRAYDTVHVPRAAYIANASLAAGKTYHGSGPSGSTDEGRRRDLNRQFDGVWNHDTRTEVARAVEELVGQGIFQRDV